jgi:hypothetical protein
MGVLGWVLDLLSAKRRAWRCMPGPHSTKWRCVKRNNIQKALFMHRQGTWIADQLHALYASLANSHMHCMGGGGLPALLPAALGMQSHGVTTESGATYLVYAGDKSPPVAIVAGVSQRRSATEALRLHLHRASSSGIALGHEVGSTTCCRHEIGSVPLGPVVARPVVVCIYSV